VPVTSGVVVVVPVPVSMVPVPVSSGVLVVVPLPVAGDDIVLVAT
jgi:hypothetical protein